ncbi:MAG: lasso peptide biosynthesis B2 protein [Gemmatimonadaceae bacterium]
MPGRLRRFLRLPTAEQRLTAIAIVTVAAARLALWTLPFPLARGTVARLGGRGRRPARLSSHMPVTIARAVTRASRVVPRASCLVQALAASALLERAGHVASVRIGVARDGRRGFEAHAWVESGGRVVVGDVELDRFTPLLALGNDVQ